MPIKHAISVETAVEMTSRFREKREEIIDGGYQNQNVLPLSETFDKDSIIRLLEVGGATFFRIYYGMTPDYKVHAVMVAADAEGMDILPSADANAIVLDSGQRCPTTCPPSSELNED